jgi:hypothetical protein
MSRKLISALTAVVALGGLVAGATMVWSNTARSIGTPSGATVPARADFDQSFASVTDAPTREYVPSFLAMIDFHRHFAGENALPPVEYVPVPRTAIEFDHVFDSVNRTRADNTPPNRERLRNAGWRRLLQASAQS